MKKIELMFTYTELSAVPTRSSLSRRRTLQRSFLLSLLVVALLSINTSIIRLHVVVAGGPEGVKAATATTATTTKSKLALTATATAKPNAVPSAMMKKVPSTTTRNTESGAPAPSLPQESKSPFKIIIDGGSTGSRLHVFEFVVVKREEEDARYQNESHTDSDGDDASEKHDGDIDESRGTNGTRTDLNGNRQRVQCVRRGSTRADVPLSAFGRLPSEVSSKVKLDPAHVAAHMIPLFEYAASVIPPQYHDTTSVYYQATAGMRLLDVDEQQAVYDALFQGLQQDRRFVFNNGLERRNVATLSGELEAYFGAVAANFLHGVIDTELRLVPSQDGKSDGQITDGKENARAIPQPAKVVGALDMGGSSTQIVYMADPEKIRLSSRNDAIAGHETCMSDEDQLSQTCRQSSFEAPKISDDHFFSTSYLSYGVDQFRERMWTHLVKESIQEEGDYPESCVSKYIHNPCANVGYTVEWQGYTLVGTGDTKGCIQQTQRLIPHPEIPLNYSHHDDNTPMRRQNIVGGIEHPPVRGKFLAMSLYFFTLDSLREFSNYEPLHLSWPTPSIQELHDALEGLCARDWHSDMALQEGVHQYSRPAVLPHRCIESVYLVTLLRDGFGFEPSSRDITFTYKVDGDEVEWTLGMALAMNAEERIDEQKEMEDDAHRKPRHTESIDQQLSIQAAAHPYLFFGVTSAPTYCC